MNAKERRREIARLQQLQKQELESHVLVGGDTRRLPQSIIDRRDEIKRLKKGSP